MSQAEQFGSFLRQPLLHFLVLGGLIFAAYAWLSPAEPPGDPEQETVSRRIVVDRPALLEYLQYRARAFEPEVFGARLDAMTEDERLALANDYVREEALFRESLRMGMDAGDYIIRQRLVQKVEFLLENLAATEVTPDPEELETFFAERRDDYVVDAVYTFTHIFFDAQQGGMDEARVRAGRLLDSQPDIVFDEAGRHGDRFPFLQNYVARTRDFIVNNFGVEFVAELDQTAQTGQWSGPVASRYGQHLVLLRERREPFVPLLEEIEERVLDDYRYEALARSRQAAEERVVADYDVVLELQ